MLHATQISTLIDGRSTTYAPSGISAHKHADGTLDVVFREEEVEGHAGHVENRITIPTERKISVTSDLHRQRWYLHVSMAAGRVDITVASHRQQSSWLVILLPVDRRLTTTTTAGTPRSSLCHSVL